MFKQFIEGRYYYWVVGVLILFYAALSYYGQLIHSYPVPPGDDIFSHLSAMEILQNNSSIWFSADYPIGFRKILVIIAEYFNGGELLQTTLYVWPVLPVISSFVIWLVSCKVFSKKVGLLTLVIYALMSLQPQVTLYDGGLPNLFAGNILLPISILLWIRIWEKWQHGIRGVAWYILSFLAVSTLIVYSHHLSFIVWLGVIGSTAAVLLFNDAYKRVKGSRWPVLFTAMVFMGIAVILIYNFPIFDPVRNLIVAVLNYTSPVDPWSISRYHTSINGLLFQGSILGLGLLGYSKLFLKRPLNTGELVIIFWFALYLIGSRMTFIAEPGRLARDLAMPGAMLAAYFLVNFVGYLNKKSTVVGGVLLVVVLLQVLLGTAVKAREMVAYNSMVRFSNSDVELLRKVETGEEEVLAVSSHGVSWQYMAKDYILSQNVVMVNKEKDARHLLRLGLCVYLEVYKEGVWPETFTRNPILENLLLTDPEDGRYSSNIVLTDELKDWYKVCRD